MKTRGKEKKNRNEDLEKDIEMLSRMSMQQNIVYYIIPLLFSFALFPG